MPQAFRLSSDAVSAAPGADHETPCVLADHRQRGRNVSSTLSSPRWAIRVRPDLSLTRKGEIGRQTPFRLSEGGKALVLLPKDRTDVVTIEEVWPW